MKIPLSFCIVWVIGTSGPAFADDLTVTVTGGPTVPNPCLVGTQTTTPLNASVNPPPVMPQYVWSVESVQVGLKSPTNTATSGYYASFDNPSGPQTNLIAVVYKPGYWAFNLRLDVVDPSSGSGAMTQSGTGRFTVSFLAQELVIKRKTDGGKEYEEIDAKNKNTAVLPGEFIDLKVETKPAGGVITDPLWTLPAVTFKDYTSSAKEAQLKDVPAAELKKEAVQFYWADSGEKKISVTAKIGGQETKAEATMSVKALTTSFTVTEFGKVYIVPNYKPPSIPGQTTTAVGLFKNDKGDMPGIKLAGKVQVPKDFPEGSWRFVQLVSDRQVYLKGAEKQGLNTGGFVLDTKLPYPAIEMAADPTKDNPTGNTAYHMMDTLEAYALLTNGVNELVFDRVVRTSSFKTYILFKPAGAKSQYVSLKRFDWNWKGQAIRVAGTKTFILGKESEGQKADAAVDDTQQPKWKKNYADFEVEEIK
jgi:hypothetical protein